MTYVAWQLTDEYSEVINEGTVDERQRFDGGVIGLPPDGEAFDVGAALKAGNGVVVVNAVTEPSTVDLLDQQTYLERTEVPPEAYPSTYDQRTARDLRGEAKDRGIEGFGRASRDELVAVLTRHDVLVARGDQAAAEHAKDPDFDPASLEATGDGDASETAGGGNDDQGD